jgi:DNA repair exonuclease SbcCD nuclease subunit
VTFTIAHLSDTHIGYEAYKTLSASGENQRSVDVAKAFVSAVTDIVAADPPLVVHSGDMADRTIIPIRLILLIRQQLQRLASIRPDGSRRQVVIIAGNHEIPRNRKEACFLHLFDGLPGVHVVTRDFQQVVFDGRGASENAPAELASTVVHCLPHDALKTVEFDTVVPAPDKVNVLVAHGVAGGSELYLRSLGREFTIPTEVLSRSWDYVALGHWHKQGPVPLVALGAQGDDRGRVWYAGSTENMGFGDLRENGLRRGWLHVTVRPGDEPAVERRHVPIRAMLRLPVLDAENMTPEQIADTLVERARAHPISGAVVSQMVENVPRDVWSLVDLPRVRLAASDALHYEVSLRSRPRATAPDTAGDDAAGARETRGLGDAERVLLERAEVLLAEHERSGGLAMARELLAVELERSVRALETSSDADKPADVETPETPTEPAPAAMEVAS